MMLIKEGFNDLDWIYIPRTFLSFLYVLDFKKGDLSFHGEGKIQKVLQTNKQTLYNVFFLFLFIQCHNTKAGQNQ